KLAVLEGPREAEPRDLVRRAPRDVGVAEADGAAAAVDAADAVEHAGLAGAVRADQREQLARRNRERHVLEHGKAAETQAQARNLKLSHTTSATGDIASPPGTSVAHRPPGRGRIPARPCGF